MAEMNVSRDSIIFSKDHEKQGAYGVWVKVPKDELATILKAGVNLDLDEATRIFDIPSKECFIAPVATITREVKSMVTGRTTKPKPFHKHVAINIQHCLTKPGLEEHIEVRYYLYDPYGKRCSDELFKAEHLEVNPDLLPAAGRVSDVFYTLRKITRTIVVFTLYQLVVVCTSRLVGRIDYHPNGQDGF